MTGHSLLPFCALLLSFIACKPEKPVPEPSEPSDGRQKFVGVYDVYDTLSNWRYEMEITLNEGSGFIDSVFISNWGGDFIIYCQHDNADQSNYLGIGGHFGITDHQGNRWALFREYDPLFNNTLGNDTLRMSYLKDNIAFYVADGIPYFRQSYREYAVKRDWE